jgi:hypothetical protein
VWVPTSVWTCGGKNIIPVPELTAAIFLTFCRKRIHETGIKPDNALDLFASDIFLSYTLSKKKLLAALRIATSDLRPFSAPSTNLQVTTI